MYKLGFNSYEIRGDITAIIIINRKGEKFETLIDTDDLEKLIKLNYRYTLKWDNVLKSYYVKACVYLGKINGKYKYKNIPLHNIVMNRQDGEVVDHLNHNTLDNRKENLMIRTQHINLYNRKSANSNNKSGYRNVTWDKSKQKWIVQLQINCKNKCLGAFEDVHEAGKFAEEMRQKYYKPILENNHV